MRAIVVGYGVQGKKRAKFAGADCVAIVDPVAEGVDYKNIEEVDLNSFDAALVCTPDEPKYQLLSYLLKNAKHVLVEKPLYFCEPDKYSELSKLAKDNKAVCYTAYNHRFEPHFINIKNVIDSGELGNIHLVKMFYGNGTARDVRNSVWRDAGSGVLDDIGSHLLDTLMFMFGKEFFDSCNLISANCFENRAPDHVLFKLDGNNNSKFYLETTLLSWRNTFRMDVFGEAGSAHIDCLCKWGPSNFIVRNRVLPSGRPAERVETLECADPTWEAEYAHFLNLVKTGQGNIENDIWLADRLQELHKDISL